MSKIFLSSEDPRHFLVDSRGDMWEVSKEIADLYATLMPRCSASVERIDLATKTIWFSTPLPSEVKADG